MADPTNAPVSYWLDEDNRIAEVSGGSWDAFARENRGDAVASDRVIGRSLLEFIAGDTTRMWVHSVISYARILGKEVSREYRCDSPSERRYMRMDITPLPDGRLQVDHWLLRKEGLRGRFDFTATPENDSSTLPRCSICNQIRIRDFWVEPHPEALEQSGDGGPIPVVYTVCDGCREALRRTDPVGA